MRKVACPHQLTDRLATHAPYPSRSAAACAELGVLLRRLLPPPLPGAALAARGYPAWVETAIELDVEDALLPENGGPLRLEVADGAAVVSDAAGGLSVDVSVLSALFGGWLAPRDAARAGLLTRASERELDRLEQLFAGPKPWLLEMF